MKRLMPTLVAMGCGLALGTAWAGDVPRGKLLELHSCELFAGGCTVSSQATLDGRYMLRAWDFVDGIFEGVKLAGLQLAVLQSASQNLAAEESASDQAVVYLPQSATDTERKALVAWLKSTQAELKTAAFKTRVAPLRFSNDGVNCSFGAGDFVSVSTAPLESCDKGGCGEALWYTPRTPTTMFTVAVDRCSEIKEPWLKLKWRDAGQRSVFLAKFGEPAPGKNVFVTTADFCGQSGKLF